MFCYIGKQYTLIKVKSVWNYEGVNWNFPQLQFQTLNFGTRNYICCKFQYYIINALSKYNPFIIPNGTTIWHSILHISSQNQYQTNAYILMDYIYYVGCNISRTKNNIQSIRKQNKGCLLFIWKHSRLGSILKLFEVHT